MRPDDSGMPVPWLFSNPCAIWTGDIRTSPAKAVGAAAFSEISRQLQYKCEWYDKLPVKAHPFFPSSQRGYRNSVIKDLSVREWVFPHCGTVHDRHVNTAGNTPNEGMSLLAQWGGTRPNSSV